jgi:hypothetical protein
VPLPSALDGELRGGAVMDARGRVLCLLRAREAGLPGAAAA